MSTRNRNKSSKKQKQKQKHNKKSNEPQVTIRLTTDTSTLWELHNPGPHQNVADQINQKYQVGLKLKIKMEHTPEECFKMIVTQIEEAPEHSEFHMFIDNNMSYMAFYTL